MEFNKKSSKYQTYLDEDQNGGNEIVENSWQEKNLQEKIVFYIR